MIQTEFKEGERKTFELPVGVHERYKEFIEAVIRAGAATNHKLSTQDVFRFIENGDEEAYYVEVSIKCLEEE